MRYCSVVLCVVASVCFASNIMAADEAQKEDLIACKLPHGELLIPASSAPEAKSGYILRISDGTLNPAPFKAGERARSAADFLLRIASEKAGDLMYSSLNEGSFVAVSTRASDLGNKFLYELSGSPLDRPQPVQSKKERSGAGEGVPGVIDGVQDGHCYLIEAADGKFALVRLIQKRDRSALIQYVYQPDGTRAFNIPKGNIASAAPASASSAPVGESARSGTSSGGISIENLNVRDFAKACGSHLENRKTVIELSINLISLSNSDLSNRALAASLLGQLRATEAAPTLAAHVDDDLAVQSRRTIVRNSYRCAQALIDIDTPGARAAMSQIEADAKSVTGKDSDLRQQDDRLDLRRNLLALVVLKVYGEKLAKTALEDKIEGAADPTVKEAYQKALEAFPRIKNWLPEERTATTMPAAPTSKK